MGVIFAFALIVAGILGGALTQQLADEFKAWTPSLVSWLIRRAVRHLPAQYRERYREEWNSHIEDVPGQIGKIFGAAGLSLASARIQNGYRQTLAEESLHNAIDIKQIADNAWDDAFDTYLTQSQRATELDHNIYYLTCNADFLERDLKAQTYKGAEPYRLDAMRLALNQSVELLVRWRIEREWLNEMIDAFNAAHPTED